MSLETLEAIKTRRVTRFFDDKAVTEDMLWQILGAARWAPTASGRRTLRYVCVVDKRTIKQIKLVTPGMVGNTPAALIVICVNWSVAGLNNMERELSRGNTFIDVGTSMVCMLLAAHSLGIGAGPITSFSPDAVAELLNIPVEYHPEMLITLGYPIEIPQSGFKLPKVRIPIQDLVQWGAYSE
jgi:nitroreductase